MQTHNLLASLVQLFEILKSGVFLVHSHSTHNARKGLLINVPAQ